MSPEMHTALWITAVGSAVLFGSITCLIGLMYLLTAPWLFPQAERRVPRIRRKKRRRHFRRRASDADSSIVVASGPSVVSGSSVVSGLSRTPQALVDEIEHERRRRAVALAVAIACAESGQTTDVPEAPADWRLLHRARRLGGSLVRRKARS